MKRPLSLRPQPAVCWVLTGLLAAFPSCLLAADWPFYRGPNHDGISLESIRTNWSAEPPRRLWQVPIEPGLSSASVSGGRVFTLIRRLDENVEQEFCVALNADTGAALWRSLRLGIADYPYGGVGPDDGPRSTPSVDGQRVYVLTSYLQLFCLNVTNGFVLWSRNLQSEYGGEVIPWENAASPLIEGNLVLVNGNASGRRLMAFQKLDGVDAWKRWDDAMTQSSPIAATIAGVRQAIFFTQSGLVSVRPQSGDVLWRYPFSYSTSTAASPVVGDDAVYCSAAYGTGGGAVRIGTNSAGMTTNQLWRLPGTRMNHWATPVYHEGHLYGIYGQSSPRLECINMTTGERRWFQSGFGYGSTLNAGGTLIVLSEAGALTLVEPSTNGFRPIGSFQAVDPTNSFMPGLPVKCWNSPAISGGRIYIRSSTALAAIDVSPQLPPPLRFEPSLGMADGIFQLRLGNQNGSALDSNRLSRIDTFATTQFPPQPGDWIKLTNALTLSNGQAHFNDPRDEQRPRRFYRAVERP